MKLSSIIALVASASSAAAFSPTQSSSSSSTALDAAISKSEILKSPDTTETGKVWDPLGLAEIGSDETLAWYRHSEIKHGRIAMAAFVGWWAVGAGLRLPGQLAYGLDFASIPSKGLEAWDAVPGWGKAQMLLFAGLIEFHDELFYSRRGTHYMKGGIPGKVSQLKLYKNFGGMPYINTLPTYTPFCAFFRTWFLGSTILLVGTRTRTPQGLPRAAILRSRMDVWQ